jgi:hypothetical protein
MLFNRYTEEFVRCVKVLDEHTSGDPDALRDALDSSKEVGEAVVLLAALHEKWKEHSNTSPNKRIVQCHPQFLSSLRRYEEVWSDSFAEKIYWEMGPEAEASIKASIDETFSQIGKHEGKSGSSEESWDFDPATDSCARAMDGIIAYAEERANEYPYFHKAQVAAKWFSETVGLELSDIEKRWKEFPVIIVKQRVSDKHGLTESKSLYAYLANIRRAYVVGADLAALAMCRSVTEILMRHHFKDGDMAKASTSGKKNKEIPLGPLARDIVGSIPSLKTFNLEEKIREANQLMHFNRDHDAEKWSNVQSLVRNWVLVLNDFIDAVPERDMDCDP